MIDVDAELADVRLHLVSWERAIAFVKAELASGQFTESAARVQIRHFRRCAEKVKHGLFKAPGPRSKMCLGPLTDGTTPTPLIPDNLGWADISPGVRRAENVGLSSLVERCRKQALLQLAERGVVVGDGVAPYQAVTDAGFEPPSPEWHLSQIENYARKAQGSMENGDLNSALGLAVKLGIYLRDFEILEYEKPLVTGLKQIEHLAAGSSKGNKAKTKKSQTWKRKVQARADSIWRRHPGLSATAVARMLINAGVASAPDKHGEIRNLCLVTVRKAIEREKVGISR